jgi:mannose-6-phosphate isomerase-like protein (cupin superfamily)
MSTSTRALIVRRGEGTSYKQGPALFQAAGHQTNGRFDFFEMNIEYLTGPGLHRHANQDDTFYVLEGVLTIQCGDDVFDLGPGDFISIPPKTPHTFDNTKPGQPPVRVINLMTPGGYDGLFAENEKLDKHRATASDQREVRSHVLRPFACKEARPAALTQLGRRA